MKTIQKELVEVRISDLSTVTNQIKHLQAPLDRIAKGLAACGLDLSLIDPEPFMIDPRGYLLRYLPEDFKALAKMVNSSALQWPTVYDSVIKAVEEEKSKNFQLLAYSPFFKFDEGGVKAVPEKFAELREMYTVYATNDIEVKRLAMAKNICNVLQQYQTTAREHNSEPFSVFTGLEHTLRKVVYLDGEIFRPVAHSIKKNP